MIGLTSRSAKLGNRSSKLNKYSRLVPNCKHSLPQVKTPVCLYPSQFWRYKKKSQILEISLCLNLGGTEIESIAITEPSSYKHQILSNIKPCIIRCRWNDTKLQPNPFSKEYQVFCLYVAAQGASVLQLFQNFSTLSTNRGKEMEALKHPV
jgi:hypothetical protein